ncbi:hypothetical protein CPB84DRAFT_1783645 [Gymnopilus junonius]|uniref:Uncharacterized protein n=1 Tax=Gymnopilus junonius TaxID=109634 RepID=A0A9P5NKG8_GYMJU|nr:hypothetical protein CPB84DRAFT_1783645 [Gymnopilus junonius]
MCCRLNSGSVTSHHYHFSMDAFPYSERKQLFIEKRKAFKQNPQSQGDLKAYECGDNQHNFTVLKGLIPLSLVGKKTPGGSHVWEKSDTFFTDYKENHPDQILSESDESYVIGNLASHDTRQYLAKWDPEGKDRTATAGMSYMHLLVIPKKRIYNAVALDDTHIIDEMMRHFHHFWSTPESADKIIACLDMAVKRRTKAARETLMSHKPDLVDDFDATMKQVEASAQELAANLRECQKSQDDKALFFGFHPAPEASVAYLHMHTLLPSEEFRQFSTRKHDWKTVPAQVIIDVIEEETARCETNLPNVSWWRLR